MVQQLQLEIKKMKQGMSYSCKEKTIILNVFKYFCTQFPDKCVTEIVRRTAKATGCSEKSIFQFRKEEASGKGFKEPSKTKIRKNININSRDIKYDETVRQGIRRIIYDLKYKNMVPSLNNILKQVSADSQLPNFSLMTLRRLMFDMGFYYEKNGNKSVLVEKHDSSSAPASKTLRMKKPIVQNRAVANQPLQQNNFEYVDCAKVASSEAKKVDDQLNINHTVVGINTEPSVHVAHLHPNPMPVPPMNEHDNQPRLMQMHVPPPENHIVTPMHPMTMVPSHSFPPNLDLTFKRQVSPWMYPASNDMANKQPNSDFSVKREIPPWMYPPPNNNMVKQQQ